MIRQLSTRACIAAICIFAAVTAQAATLEILENQAAVKANFGGGFGPVSNGAQLQPGDSVMAQPGGSAQIVYEGGCTEPVNIDTDVVVVKAEPPCVGATTGGWGHVPPGVGDWAMWTLPGAAVIGGLIFLFKDDDSGVLEVDRPASP